MHGEERDILYPVFLAIIIHGQTNGLIGMVFIVICAQALGMCIVLRLHFHRYDTATLLYHEVNLVSAALRGVVIRLA